MSDIETKLVAQASADLDEQVKKELAKADPVEASEGARILIETKRELDKEF